ncbi:cyclase family protein [Pendulispora rubella]|uniref:Cyclase family protein n=1 Tax=Pendulispora rubella TaxID=2741070 RepID=A0ABZ2L2M7_9BACT
MNTVTRPLLGMALSALSVVACVQASAAPKSPSGTAALSAADPKSAVPVSKWGADDEIGAANELKPALVVAATKLVKTGKTYQLGMEVNKSTPAFRHRNFRLITTNPGQEGGKTEGPNKFTYNDEHFEGWLGVGTQLNGLGHIGIDSTYYNANRARDFVDIEGVKKLGLEKTPPIVTRGVLLDMAAYYGTDVVKEGTAFSPSDIETVLKKENVTIQPGDVVIFHTGWLDLAGKDNARFLAGEPGINRAAAQYLAEKRVVAVGADNWALEAVPFEKGAGTFEGNQTLITKNGIYVLENLVTKDLAHDKVYEFLFVLGHPRYTGTTQSIINPVAIH